MRMQNQRACDVDFSRQFCFYDRTGCRRTSLSPDPLPPQPSTPEGAGGEATHPLGCWYTLLQPRLARVCVCLAAGSKLQWNQESTLIWSDMPEHSLLISQQTAWGGGADFTLVTFLFNFFMILFLLFACHVSSEVFVNGECVSRTVKGVAVAALFPLP